MNDARYTFDEIPVRSANVLFDALEGWFIEDRERIDLRSPDDRVRIESSWVRTVEEVP
jgi:hypothetical protein